MSKMINILSCDPGLRNFAISIIQMKLVQGQLSFRVRENILIPSTVTQLANSTVLRAEGQAYKALLTSLIEKYNIDVIAAERYMSRGMGGVTIEVVNFMLGWLCIEYSHIPQRLLSAATWKNGVRRRGVELDKMYKLTKVTPHQLDSALIGIFTGAIAFKQKDFGTLNLKKIMPKLLLAMEDTSTTRLINRVIPGRVSLKG